MKKLFKINSIETHKDIEFCKQKLPVSVTREIGYLHVFGVESAEKINISPHLWLRRHFEKNEYCSEILKEIVNKITIKVVLGEGWAFYLKTMLKFYVFTAENAKNVEKWVFPLLYY